MKPQTKVMHLVHMDLLDNFSPCCNILSSDWEVRITWWHNYIENWIHLTSVLWYELFKRIDSLKRCTRHYTVLYCHHQTDDICRPAHFLSSKQITAKTNLFANKRQSKCKIHLVNFFYSTSTSDKWVSHSVGKTLLSITHVLYLETISRNLFISLLWHFLHLQNNWIIWSKFHVV